MSGIVVISICSAEDRYLISEIQREFDNVKLIKLNSASYNQSFTSKSDWQKPLSKLYWWVSHQYYQRLARRIEIATTRILETSHDKSLSVHPDWEMAESEANSNKMVTTLNNLKPDYIVVSGAPILRTFVIDKAKKASLNVHHGIAPEYRGADSNWWARYHGDFDKVGVTIHLMDQGLDTGDIIGQGYVSVCPTANEAEVNAKCARIAADHVVNFLRNSTKSVTAKPQHGRGRVFRYSDRRLWHDFIYQFKKMRKRKYQIVTQLGTPHR